MHSQGSASAGCGQGRWKSGFSMRARLRREQALPCALRRLTWLGPAGPRSLFPVLMSTAWLSDVCSKGNKQTNPFAEQMRRTANAEAVATWSQTACQLRGGNRSRRRSCYSRSIQAAVKPAEEPGACGVERGGRSTHAAGGQQGGGQESWALAGQGDARVCGV